MSALSRIAAEWAVRCFGADHYWNRAVRALRTLEEAAELAQALNVPEEKAIQCIKTVYSRPVGDAKQELGGVLLTTAILIESMNLDYNDVLECELRRVLKKDTAHFAKRNQEKIDLGLDIAPPGLSQEAYDNGPGAQPTMTTHTDQDGCRISRPVDIFKQVCIRDHLCATIGEGPCNGLPRPVHMTSDERNLADDMWRHTAWRSKFESASQAAGYGLPACTDGNYKVRFNRWATAQLRLHGDGGRYER